MNNSQQFDEHIKEQFSNYAPEVDPLIWEHIYAENERRKPVGFWISLINNRNRLVLLGLLITISTAGTWLYMNNGFTSARNKTAANTRDVKAERKNDLSKNDVPGKNKTSGQLNVVPVPDDEHVTAANNASPDVHNTTASTTGKTKFQINSPSLITGDEGNKMENKRQENKKNYTGLGSVLAVNTQSPDMAEDDLTGQGTLLGRLTFEAGKFSASSKKRNKPGLSFSPIIYLPDCPIEKNAAGNKKYLEIYGGPDYVFRTLSDTGSSVYLQKRKESSKFKSAFSAGIRYTKVFNNSMSVRGGVNYSQINEKFTYNQGNLVQVTYIIDANGDTTGTYITTGTRYKTTINKYRSIDVPVVVGYEVGNGKLHANINAGIVINLYSWQKGEVLDNNLNPVNITTGKSSSPYQFKTNAGIGFTGGISVFYKLNDRIHVMAEPYFRYNLTPLNKENITLKQKYHTAGLRLGIRLDLK